MIKIRVFRFYMIAVSSLLFSCGSSETGVAKAKLPEINDPLLVSENAKNKGNVKKKDEIISYKKILPLTEAEDILKIDIDEGLSKSSSISKTSGAYFQKGTGYSVAVSVGQQINPLAHNARKKYFDIKQAAGENKIKLIEGIGDDAFVIPGLNGQTIYVLYNNYYIQMTLYNELFNGNGHLLSQLAEAAVENLKKEIVRINPRA